MPSRGAWGIIRGPSLRALSVGAWRSLVARIVRDDEVGGSNPLAPTTYEYSDLRRERCSETVSDGVCAEVDGRFCDPENVDPIEQGACKELTARAALSLPPGLWQIFDIADRDVRRDVVRSLAGLGRRKGQIAPGFDADLVVWDPEAEVEINAEQLHFRHKVSPYLGRRLMGRVEATFLRGKLAYDGSGHPAGPVGAPVLGRDTRA